MNIPERVTARKGTLIATLNRAIADERYFLSRRVQALKSISGAAGAIEAGATTCPGAVLCPATGNGTAAGAAMTKRDFQHPPPGTELQLKAMRKGAQGLRRVLLTTASASPLVRKNGLKSVGGFGSRAAGSSGAIGVVGFRRARFWRPDRSPSGVEKSLTLRRAASTHGYAANSSLSDVANI